MATNSSAGAGVPAKVTNLRYMQELSDGDNAMVKEMINMFLNLIPGTLKQMMDCYNNKDLTQLKMLAHKSKPSYGLIGCQLGQDLLKKVEININESPNFNKIGEWLNETQTVTAACIQELNLALSEMNV